ncbi:glutamine amidotransferase of anthranilate synthase [Methylorubrum populi BJ001]|jgi:anthranilate synthase component 2|uniref:Glutamine amidotransferase of anthranilate synthase n=2 Tax=Methylorubrum TaxID=2282523 RepID=B1Z9R8_METPB|nr:MULTISPECIES: aminodeoxychorismate/anthranilate synthase component II [Methylorubrum]ACB83304.1 glutamine amidotransferase of anthranilate synthase [Methylorubrum populi BJ001]MBA8912012.1 anthranilate synthase component 2 [Methylorubrum thiocyanatum]OAH38269.1 anthranilate synthase [Methylorubrum populi]PZP68253.1 MAG: aminodeoxychorismate/anthranilate synthase component II [Methylorubrum populi]QDI83331.1 aminodeoxychorismate/anthranilate synthase component II [Methylorubrum populi]
MSNVLVIDNYDSFTWNLVHLIGPLCERIDVVRNDQIDVAGIRERAPDALVLSPGPCTPNEAGICLDVVRELGAEVPIFGVCLGLQTIGQAYGGDVVRAPSPMHGKISTIRHEAEGVFRGINEDFAATRYHSLVVDRASCPKDLAVTAEADGLIMGLQHRELPVHGVQFHPESILSNHGTQILRNFLDIAAAWRKDSAGRA